MKKQKKQIKCPLKPSSRRIVITPADGERKLKSGIIVPQLDRNEMPQGKVVAIGGKVSQHEDISIGDIVVYSKTAGYQKIVNGQEYIIIHDIDYISTIL